MTNDNKKIVDGLRRLDALLVWPDEPNPHIHKEAADAIERLTAEVKRLTRELKSLQADHEKERAMCIHIARKHGKEIAQNADLQIELDAVVHDRDALNTGLVQARKERNAAIRDMRGDACLVCAHYEQKDGQHKCNRCENRNRFEWRGVCAENGGVSIER